jgi:hypothetical protein
MVSIISRRRLRPRRFVGTLALVALGASVLAACGSSSSASASAVGTPLQQACTAVGDVLANGPDPGADPLGYAEAQPRPLAAIKTSDTKLKTAVTDLAHAYQSFSTTNGSSAAKAAVKSAAAKVNAVCPGAAS